MDPAMATMGRGRPPDTRWLPQVHQYQKEMVVFLCLVCTVLAVCLLLYFLDSRQVNHDTKWADLPWVASSCVVKEVGVAYRGTCRLDTSYISAPTHHFAECDGPADSLGGKDGRQEVRRAWLRTEAGQCAMMGDRDYHSAEALVNGQYSDTAGDGLDTTSEEITGDDFGFSRRLRQEAPALSGASAGFRLASRRLVGAIVPRTRSQLCHNGYLAWALVLLANVSGQATEAPVSRGRCAYRFGAPAASTTADWDEAARHVEFLKAHVLEGKALRCWRLRDDDCVVASSPLRELAAEQREGAALAMKLGVVLSFGALLLAAIGGYLHFQDNGCCGFAPPGGYHSSLPTGDPDDAVTCTVAG
eukprot:CAMPEP_0176010848 /NCGR_PEP_ID=MMETSP0120_2-20121206/4983_1 /TAXON_ID=160619 /ORGANISM="Kryptoperidinium foliaceum, Strain CCMP 1326" /LENGTH=358 /DNA_ID=CAMNT_0017343699 /DNA_START=1 /DNA_END=1073 /DNA_ORIENTATION=+